MFALAEISLYQFRNYQQFQLSLNQRVVGVCGNNGSGKTNLLDAIYYLSFTKSYLGKPDAQNVMHNTLGMRIVGKYALPNNKEANVTCIIRENGKKEIALNGEDYKKYSEHIGKFPCVMIAPDDIQLITGGSEERRKLIDTILSQIDRNYLDNLIAYNKILQQRNAFLKQINETGLSNCALLEIYTQQLAEKAQQLFDVRKVFLETFLPKVVTYYYRIANAIDAVSLVYKSQLEGNNIHQLLQQSLSKDMALQRTTVGIHKDDIECTLASEIFKTEASQGQRKSLLFALKLAEWSSLQQHKQVTPILLLDDVFEKLDENRMHNLLAWVCVENKGQVVISDTHPERLSKHLQQLGVEFQLEIL